MIQTKAWSHITKIAIECHITSQGLYNEIPCQTTNDKTTNDLNLST